MCDDVLAVNISKYFDSVNPEALNMTEIRIYLV